MPLLDHVPGSAPTSDRYRLRFSLAGLVFGNLVLMWSVLIGWITVGEAMWTYWLHSVIIGAFNIVRIRSLKRFSTEGLKSNGHPVPATPEGQRSTANFFLIHYGFFHLAYLVFLLEHLPAGGVWFWLVIAAAGLGASEWATFVRHRETDATWEPNLGTLMFQPYIRIIPMHLSIMAVGVAGLVFLPLKLLADIGMFLMDEHIDAKRARLQNPGTLSAAATNAPPG
jgi:hypothetical protein